MIPKDCKRLIEVDFPIVIVTGMRRGRSLSGMGTLQPSTSGGHGGGEGP